MAKSRTRTTKKSTTPAEDEESMVQCSSCEGWTYLEETPFENLEEAKDKTYTCKHCTKISTLYASLALQEKTMRAEFNLQVDTMKEQWKASETAHKTAMKELVQELSTERTLREELSTKVAALQAEVDKLRPSKGHLDTDDTDVHTGDALFTEQKNELQPRDSEQQNTAKVLSNSMAKDETEEDREAGPWLKVGKNNRVENPTKEKATTQRSNEQSVPKKWNQPKQQLRYTQSQHRRSVVLGDSNAHRLKRQLHKDVSDWRLRVTTKPGATMEETLLRAEKEIEQANSAETKLQLILHVGSTDILNEKEPHRSIEQLKQKLTAWSQADPQHHYILCATPELTPRGPHVVTACREWNKQANELCTMLGPQVEFFSTTNQMDGDYLEDIHYTEATGTHVGHLLAMKVANFLGVYREHHGSSPQARRRLPKQDHTMRAFLKAMTTAFTQMSQPNRRR